MEQSISLEKQLNIIQFADLVLPDEKLALEEYTTIDFIVAMLIVISTFALDFIRLGRSIFKIVDLDSMEAFTGSTRKEALSWAGFIWSCYEPLGIFRDPKIRTTS